jgi:aerobic-type carbon monoxide dehydrogenase small subunit (CoxS/CutS family)
VNIINESRKIKDATMAQTVTINGKSYEINVDGAMPLLWFLRDKLELTGTKFGCGMAVCGACTVHLDGQAIRSCVLPVSAVAGKSITTIEGLSENDDHPLQKAWLNNKVPQCGYCQAGQIMNAASFLAQNPSPTPAEIDTAMQGNICRCGTYQRIKIAISEAALELGKEV